jgi:dipeptidyl aminopeptidase/acylaminoacyl peptidase
MNLIGANASPEWERAHSPHHNVPPTAPPVFLLHAEDHASVVVENSLLLRAALLAKKIPVETHLFADGGRLVLPSRTCRAAWAGSRPRSR